MDLRSLLPMVFGLVALASCRDSSPSTDDAPTPAPAEAKVSIDPLELNALQPSSFAPPAGSQTPNLFVTPRGELLLSWLEPAETPTADTPTADTNTPGTTIPGTTTPSIPALRLRLARRTAQGWTAPVTVTEGPLLDNWADFPAVGGLADGTLVATWLVPLEHGYEIHWARSIDDGASWSTPQRLHEHTGGPEYGFVSMAVDPEGRLALYWLDGRASTPEGGQMQLRTAVIGREGPPAERGLVDDRVCDCCQTSAASTPTGTVVAYRNRSGTEIRDIHVAGPHPRLGEAVHDDDWVIMGCPVNGPSLAAVGPRLAVAWFTAADDEPRVRAAFGAVGGDFEAPAELHLGLPVGRVSLVMPDEQTAVVTFVERHGEAGEATIVARRLAGTVVGPAYAIASTTAARASGFPRSALLGDRVVWAWTEVSPEGPRVRVAEAPVAALG